MIYTVTVNPSLDYIVSVNDFKLGLTNRTDSELMLPGGKGINVSMVLSNLGIESTAIGFVAGFTGDELLRRLKEAGINEQFIKVPGGETRINVKLKSVDGTEINGKGPDITEEEAEQLIKQLEKCKSGDLVFLAGSIPASISKNYYQTIMERLICNDVQIVVDATGKLLTNVLPLKPFLVKPNNHELGEIFGVELKTRDQVIPYAKRLQEMGARNVLVSMAAEGAVLVAEDGTVISEPAPEGKLVNGVGAGDSMVAGFMAGWIETHNYERAYRLGASAGSASAFSEFLATRDEIVAVYERTFGKY